MKLTTEITEDNYFLEAAKAYQKRLCFSSKAFYSDANALDIKSDITRFFGDVSEDRVRSLINKLIVAGNLFGVRSVDLILFRLRNHERHFSFVCQLYDVIGILPNGTKFTDEIELRDIINVAISKT